MVSFLYQVDASTFSEKFIKHENFSEILELGKTCRLSVLNNRLTCWRLFLNIFNESEPCEKWIQDLESFRSSYLSLKSSHLNTDFDLTSKIVSSENVQKLGLNIENFFEILKIWAEVNTCEVSEQVIEILCVVFAVTEVEKFSRAELGEGGEVLRKLNDPKFIVCDTYQVFERLMAKYYLVLFSKVSLGKKGLNKTMIEFKCLRIYNFYLKSLDPELYNYLKSNLIETEKYLA